MKINTTYWRSIWIIILSILCTGYICFLSICKNLCKNINRQWVDNKLKIWSDFLLKLIEVKLVINNKYLTHPIDGRATIVMCNHSSLYDIPLSLRVFPQHSMRMLAKKELSKIPIMGKGMSAAEFLFIDRTNRKQAMHDLIAMQNLLRSGIIMWVAPEGTRSKTGILGKFKQGAFITAIETNAIIIPMFIIGADTILSSGSWRINRGQSVTINIGKAIDTKNYNMMTKADLMNQLLVEMQMLEKN